jgi:adenosylcobinamide-GDP ribazoletransferase
MRSIILAIQFLTIIPVRLMGDVTERDIARCTKCFPVVGALQGLILLVSAWALGILLPPDIVGAFIVAIAIMTNGGFHLDGLADSFDALAVKSSGNAMADVEKRLAVMKDSSTGAIGVVAVATVILLKFVLIKNVLSFPVPLTALLVLFLVPVFSKWIMVPAIYHGTSARKDGLGKILIDASSFPQVVISSALTILLFVIVFVSHLAQCYDLRGLFLFSLLPAGYILALISVAFCSSRFGGLTGDTLGALSELSEILYLAGSYIWLQHSI